MTLEDHAANILDIFGGYETGREDTQTCFGLVMAELRATLDEVANNAVKAIFATQNDAYLSAAKLVRERCKDPLCENRCYHEHAIRERAASARLPNPSEGLRGPDLTIEPGEWAIDEDGQ